MPDAKYHDPLCPRRRWRAAFYVTCQCNLIREVGERIAQTIEAQLPDKSEWTTRTMQACAQIARKVGL